MINRNFDDFEPTSWNVVEVGDVVYLRGSHDGVPVTYGPHVIKNIDRRLIKNPKGQAFMHYSEELMVKKTKNKKEIEKRSRGLS